MIYFWTSSGSNCTISLPPCRARKTRPFEPISAHKRPIAFVLVNFYFSHFRLFSSLHHLQLFLFSFLSPGPSCCQDLLGPPTKACQHHDNLLWSRISSSAPEKPRLSQASESPPSIPHISPIPQPIPLIVGSPESPCSPLSFDIHIIFIWYLPFNYHCHLPSIHHPSIILQPIHHPSLPPSPPFKPWIFITLIITFLCYAYQDPQAYWIRWELDQAVAVSGISQSC